MNSDKWYGGTSIKVYIKNERLIKDLYYIHYVFSANMLIWLQDCSIMPIFCFNSCFESLFSSLELCFLFWFHLFLSSESSFFFASPVPILWLSSWVYWNRYFSPSDLCFLFWLRPFLLLESSFFLAFPVPICNWCWPSNFLA